MHAFPPHGSSVQRSADQKPSKFWGRSPLLKSDADAVAARELPGDPHPPPPPAASAPRPPISVADAAADELLTGLGGALSSSSPASSSGGGFRSGPSIATRDVRVNLSAHVHSRLAQRSVPKLVVQKVLLEGIFSGIEDEGKDKYIGESDRPASVRRRNEAREAAAARGEDEDGSCGARSGVRVGLKSTLFDVLLGRKGADPALGRPAAAPETETVITTYVADLSGDFVLAGDDGGCRWAGGGAQSRSPLPPMTPASASASVECSSTPARPSPPFPRGGASLFPCPPTDANGATGGATGDPRALLASAGTATNGGTRGKNGDPQQASAASSPALSSSAAAPTPTKPSSLYAFTTTCKYISYTGYEWVGLPPLRSPREVEEARVALIAACVPTTTTKLLAEESDAAKAKADESVPKAVAVPMAAPARNDSDSNSSNDGEEGLDGLGPLNDDDKLSSGPALPPPLQARQCMLPVSMHANAPGSELDAACAGYRVRLGVGVLVRCHRDVPVVPTASGNSNSAAPPVRMRREYGALYNVIEVTFPAVCEDAAGVPTTRETWFWIGDSILNRELPRLHPSLISSQVETPAAAVQRTGRQASSSPSAAAAAGGGGRGEKVAPGTAPAPLLPVPASELRTASSVGFGSNQSVSSSASYSAALRQMDVLRGNCICSFADASSGGPTNGRQQKAPQKSGRSLNAAVSVAAVAAEMAASQRPDASVGSGHSASGANNGASSPATAASMSSSQQQQQQQQQQQPAQPSPPPPPPSSPDLASVWTAFGDERSETRLREVWKNCLGFVYASRASIIIQEVDDPAAAAGAASPAATPPTSKPSPASHSSAAPTLVLPSGEASPARPKRSWVRAVYPAQALILQQLQLFRGFTQTSAESLVGDGGSSSPSSSTAKGRPVQARAAGGASSRSSGIDMKHSLPSPSAASAVVFAAAAPLASERPARMSLWELSALMQHPPLHLPRMPLVKFEARLPVVISTNASRVALRNALRAAIRRTQLHDLQAQGLSGRVSTGDLSEGVVWMQLPVPAGAAASPPRVVGGGAPDFVLHIGIAPEDDAIEAPSAFPLPWVLEDTFRYVDRWHTLMDQFDECSEAVRRCGSCQKGACAAHDVPALHSAYNSLERHHSGVHVAVSQLMEAPCASPVGAPPPPLQRHSRPFRTFADFNAAHGEEETGGESHRLFPPNDGRAGARFRSNVFSPAAAPVGGASSLHTAGRASEKGASVGVVAASAAAAAAGGDAASGSTRALARKASHSSGAHFAGGVGGGAPGSSRRNSGSSSISRGNSSHVLDPAFLSAPASSPERTVPMSVDEGVFALVGATSQTSFVMQQQLVPLMSLEPQTYLFERALRPFHVLVPRNGSAKSYAREAQRSGFAPRWLLGGKCCGSRMPDAPIPAESAAVGATGLSFRALHSFVPSPSLRGAFPASSPESRRAAAASISPASASLYSAGAKSDRSLSAASSSFTASVDPTAPLQRSLAAPPPAFLSSDDKQLVRVASVVGFSLVGSPSVACVTAAADDAPPSVARQDDLAVPSPSVNCNIAFPAEGRSHDALPISLAALSVSTSASAPGADGFARSETPPASAGSSPPRGRGAPLFLLSTLPPAAELDDGSCCSRPPPAPFDLLGEASSVRFLDSVAPLFLSGVGNPELGRVREWIRALPSAYTAGDCIVGANYAGGFLFATAKNVMTSANGGELASTSLRLLYRFPSCGSSATEAAGAGSASAWMKTSRLIVPAAHVLRSANAAFRSDADTAPTSHAPPARSRTAAAAAAPPVPLRESAIAALQVPVSLGSVIMWASPSALDDALRLFPHLNSKDAMDSKTLLRANANDTVTERRLMGALYAAGEAGAMAVPPLALAASLSGSLAEVLFRHFPRSQLRQPVQVLKMSREADQAIVAFSGLIDAVFTDDIVSSAHHFRDMTPFMYAALLLRITSCRYFRECEHLKFQRKGDVDDVRLTIHQLKTLVLTAREDDSFFDDVDDIRGFIEHLEVFLDELKAMESHGPVAKAHPSARATAHSATAATAAAGDANDALAPPAHFDLDAMSDGFEQREKSTASSVVSRVRGAAGSLSSVLGLALNGESVAAASSGAGGGASPPPPPISFGEMSVADFVGQAEAADEAMPEPAATALIGEESRRGDAAVGLSDDDDEEDDDDDDDDDEGVGKAGELDFMAGLDTISHLPPSRNPFRALGGGAQENGGGTDDDEP